MQFQDPFPHDMTAAAFVEMLEKMVPHPYITADKLADENERLNIAIQQGHRDLATRLVSWSRRKDK